MQSAFDKRVLDYLKKPRAEVFVGQPAIGAGGVAFRLILGNDHDGQCTKEERKLLNQELATVTAKVLDAFKRFDGVHGSYNEVSESFVVENVAATVELSDGRTIRKVLRTNEDGGTYEAFRSKEDGFWRDFLPTVQEKLAFVAATG